MYGANATLRQESRKQFNNTNVVLSDRMNNTGYVQQKQPSYGGQDDSFNVGSSVRKSSKIDSIKAFVEAKNKEMNEQNYGRKQP